MTHEPGRDRFIIYCCEKCSRRQREELIENEATGELWCESCHDNAAEAAWDRHQQDLIENGPGPSLAEQQAEARKFK